MGRWITKNGVHIYLENEEPDLAEAIAEYYGKLKIPTIQLERKEYGKVVHEINTWYKREYVRKKIISKAINDYIYTFENKGYNNYRFIGKDNVDELLDWWEIYKNE